MGIDYFGLCCVRRQHCSVTANKRAGLVPRAELTVMFIPSQQAHQTGWRGRYTGQRCSPPSERSACTETEIHCSQPLPSCEIIMSGCYTRCVQVLSPGSSCYLCGFGQRVQSDKIDLQCPLLLHGQGQGQVAERIKSHGDLGAHRTHQGGLEKAVEDVHNDGVVSLDVVLPRLLRHNLR